MKLVSYKDHDWFVEWRFILILVTIDERSWESPWRKYPATKRKVTRMETEYQDIVMKTEYLKQSKNKIKKDIEFYKAVLNKLVHVVLSRALSTT